MKLDLRWKMAMVLVGVMVCIFLFNFLQSRNQIHTQYVDKARSVALAAESAREAMAAKWDRGLFSAEQMSLWAKQGELDKVLESVPVVSAWKIAMAKSKEGHYSFRVPKIQPRNPKNEPDELERKALQLLETKGVDECELYDSKINSIRYFRPIRLTKDCMLCHGDPALSEKYWGNNRGLDPTGVKMENWKVGEIHGAFEVVQSMDESDRAMLFILLEELGITLALITVATLLLFRIAATDVVAPVRKMVEELRTIISGLRASSDQVASAAGQVAQSSQHLAQGASEQASSLDKTSLSLEGVADMTRQNSETANKANEMALQTYEIAQTGQQAMSRMAAAINEIKKSSDSTARIVKTIDEIAFQTNLLALNAAVEAARAGDAGKGFAVVAEEVRNLAMRSAEAAKNTGAMIEQSIKDADSGVKVSNDVAAILKKIGEVGQNLKHLCAEVSSASEKQTSGIKQVKSAVVSMEKVTHSNAANSEESASASEELSAQAQELSDMVASLNHIIATASLTGVLADGDASSAANGRIDTPRPASAQQEVSSGVNRIKDYTRNGKQSALAGTNGSGF